MRADRDTGDTRIETSKIEMNKTEIGKSKLITKIGIKQ